MFFFLCLCLFCVIDFPACSDQAKELIIIWLTELRLEWKSCFHNNLSLCISLHFSLSVSLSRSRSVFVCVSRFLSFTLSLSLALSLDVEVIQFICNAARGEMIEMITLCERKQIEFKCVCVA